MTTMYVDKDEFFKGKIKLNIETVGEVTNCQMWLGKKGTEYEGGLLPSFKWNVTVPFSTSDAVLVLEEIKKPNYEYLGDSETLTEQEEDAAFALDEDNMRVTCSICAMDYDEGDVNIIDYDLDLCVQCEKQHNSPNEINPN